MSKLSAVHQKSEGGLCKTPLALQRGRYTTSKCSSLMTGDCVLSLGIKPLTSKKPVADPQEIRTVKSTKVYRTVSVYRRAVAWIEGSGLVTPQNWVCCAILPWIKHPGWETGVRLGRVDGNVRLALGELGWEGAAESQAKVVEAETAGTVRERHSGLTMSCNNSTHTVCLQELILHHVLTV